jgi:hypothetical protein
LTSSSTDSYNPHEINKIKNQVNKYISLSRKNKMKKSYQMAAVILIAVFIVVTSSTGLRWYQYVTNTETPYDEVGITLNRYMPLTARTWGCNQLKATFPQKLPPYGCSNATGKNWLQ